MTSSSHEHDQAHDHDHHHDHDHGDGHVHPSPEVLPPPSEPGTVILDIGPGRGALAVSTPARLDGEELEIRPDPGEWVGEHVAIRPRRLPAGTVHVALFDALAPGPYRLRVRFGPADGVEVPAEVHEAGVAEVTWPED